MNGAWASFYTKCFQTNDRFIPKTILWTNSLEKLHRVWKCVSIEAKAMINWYGMWSNNILFMMHYWTISSLKMRIGILRAWDFQKFRNSWKNKESINDEKDLLKITTKYIYTTNYWFVCIYTWHSLSGTRSHIYQ